jgi:hypothetical protein
VARAETDEERRLRSRFEAEVLQLLEHVEEHRQRVPELMARQQQMMQ